MVVVVAAGRGTHHAAHQKAKSCSRLSTSSSSSSALNTRPVQLLRSDASAVRFHVRAYDTRLGGGSRRRHSTARYKAGVVRVATEAGEL